MYEGKLFANIIRMWSIQCTEMVCQAITVFKNVVHE